MLIAELLDVVSREKIAARFAQAGLIPLETVTAIRRLPTIAVPAIRTAPLELQRLAYEKGLITFIPAEQEETPE